jgi:hypothetical protein
MSLLQLGRGIYTHGLAAAQRYDGWKAYCSHSVTALFIPHNHISGTRLNATFLHSSYCLLSIKHFEYSLTVFSLTTDLSTYLPRIAFTLRPLVQPLHIIAIILYPLTRVLFYSIIRLALP